MPDFSRARDVLDVFDMMTSPARAFADGVRAANDEANLCSRKLRIAIVALEALATSAGRSPGLESAMEKAMAQAAQTALDRIGALR
jgi:hypothetical protein